MVSTTRRFFLDQVSSAAAFGLSTLATSGAFAAVPAAAPGSGARPFANPASAPARPIVKLDAKDAMAVALGFVADASQVDAKKFPKYAAEQRCGSCQLFGAAVGAAVGAAAGSASGPCGIFSGKHVPAAGWCASWEKRAAAKVEPKAPSR